MTMATTSTPHRTQPQQGVRRPTARKVRVVVRRINPWSVLKMSLLFYFCLMLVVLVGLGILYGVLDSLGILDTTEELLSELGFGEGTTGFEFNAGYIFRTLLLIGLMGFTTFYQQKQMQARQDPNNPQAAQMQMFAKIMPVMLMFFAFN